MPQSPTVPPDNIVTLQLGDALELLSQLPPASLDALITDPPYGTTDAAWDKLPDFPTFFDLSYKALKPHAPLILFAQNPLAADLISANRKTFRHELVWEKSNAAGHLNSKRAPLRAHELILVFSQKACTYNSLSLASQTAEPYETKRPLGKKNNLYGGDKKTSTSSSADGRRCARDVIFCPNEAHDLRRHPTQKPEALLCYLVAQYSPPGGHICDPFMGGGTTGIASIRMGRNFTGCEKDVKYFHTAALAIAHAAPDLFPHVDGIFPL